jgi:hypothetical protein
MWVMAASPLLTCTDVRNMSAETKAIMTNPEVLDVHKDPLAKMVRFIFVLFRLKCAIITRKARETRLPLAMISVYEHCPSPSSFSCQRLTPKLLLPFLNRIAPSPLLKVQISVWTTEHWQHRGE